MEVCKYVSRYAYIAIPTLPLRRPPTELTRSGTSVVRSWILVQYFRDEITFPRIRRLVRKRGVGGADRRFFHVTSLLPVIKEVRGHASASLFG